MRRGPTPRCALKKQQPWPIIRSKKYFGERRARPRCPASPQDAQNAAQGAGMGGATAPGGPLWGPAGRCQITFSTVFLATLGYFFCRGTPCGLPRCVGTAVRARKSGMEVRTVSRGDVALAALEERWTSEEAPARPSAALPARLHPLATTRQLCRPTPPRPNNPSPSSLHMLRSAKVVRWQTIRVS